MQNLYNDLENLLKAKTEFIVGGKLSKSKISDAAFQYSETLIKILLGNASLKKQFFMEVGGATVFKQKDFLNFLKNKDFLANSYTEFKSQIGLQDDRGEYYRENKDVVLVFPYKDCVLEGGQDKEDQKRNEIFYNETLAPDEITRLKDPKALTNFKLYDSKGEQTLNAKTEIDFSKQNLIVKGNNLLALHSLKEIKSIAGQVKLIYIDPPYNTGNDSFHYNDKFNHSTWLTFMKNRLEVAKNLLARDGLIYVQCDDNENAYLKVLLDELFGRNNLMTQISWQRQPEGRTVLGQGSTFIVGATEYILCYSKDNNFAPKINNINKDVDATDKALDQYSNYFNSEGERKLKKEIKDAKGNIIKIFEHKNHDIQRVPAKEEVKIRLKNFDKLSRIAAQQEESSLQQKILSELDSSKLYSVEYVPTSGKSKGEVKKSFYYGNGIVLFLNHYAYTDGNRVFRRAGMNNFWSHDEIQVTGISEEGGVVLRRGKKPEKLLKRIIQMSTKEGDLVLDYHLGSGTTAAVAHKLKRKFIGLEQLDYEENDSVVRLKNVIKGEKSGISEDKDVKWKGGGSFVYAELKRYNQQYIDEIEKAKDSKGLKKLYEQMKDEAFFRIEIDHTKWNNGEFEKLELKKQKELLCECLDKNHLYVNLTEMEDAYFKMSKDDISLNKKFYNIS